ncbi:MAG: Flp pilus assembly protein CpaB [Robiginitomaculum sp.]|nr:MAG: Flp pilus assembly protein CpaB [Robiginitomaculum sp.]
MDTKKIILVGVLGVVSVLGFLQLQKLSAPTTVQKVAAPVVKEISTVKYTKILVAKQDIPLGTRLSPELIGWQKWPTEALNDSLIDSESEADALESYLKAVTRTTIYRGEPILKRKVVHTGTRGQMAALLRPGMRGIATRINVESAAGGFIQPGDRVDVVLTVRTEGSQNGFTNYSSATIFENVHVLAVGKVHNNTEAGVAYISGSTALLELSQIDSEVLIEAQSKGDISLVLRGLNRRDAAFVASSATKGRRKKKSMSTITLYRNGQSQHVAIEGQ